MTLMHNHTPPGLEPGGDVLDAALRLLAAGSRRRFAHLWRALSVSYWVAVIAGVSWILAMAMDRELPIKDIEREIVNTGHRVARGERLLVRATRTRTRQCEFVRRWSIVDGAGRRIDFEPDIWDAYGQVGKPDTDAQGPIIPLDAAPGRARFLSVIAWDCNPLQRALGWSIVLVQAPLEFEIVRSPQDMPAAANPLPAAE